MLKTLYKISTFQPHVHNFYLTPIKYAGFVRRSVLVTRDSYFVSRESFFETDYVGYYFILHLKTLLKHTALCQSNTQVLKS